MPAHTLLLYCRAGFEGEAAAEIQERAAALGHAGFVKAKPGSAYLSLHLYQACAEELVRRIELRSLVFARQLLVAGELVRELPVDDRVSPLLAAAAALGGPYSDVYVETADTNEAKALATFTRPFGRAFEAGARRARLLGGGAQAPRLHLFCLSSTAVWPALSWPGRRSEWPLGIPRLKFPARAPSRSTLKLDEALQVFLSPAEQAEHLRPGMAAVDLGAAPGGWTWQLVRRGLRVAAIDNGPMDDELLASGLVEHRREDGFRYRPPQPVDWLVCDMVEQPGRIARLVAQWLARGDCRRAIFNLKLPMKKRYAEVQRCRELIAAELGARPHRLDLRQLYHDREEVTGYLR